MRGVVFSVILLATPALAEGVTPVLPTPVLPTPVPPTDGGWSLMERGARMVLEGLMTEVEPALDEMGRALSEIEPALREMQPVLRDLVTLLGDIRHYHAPEKLPNGDIILRRKTVPELEREGLTGPPVDL